MTEGNHEAGATDVTVRHVRRTRRICVHNATEIGALVRLARQRLGMSQTDAAICCGVGRRFLVELENGKPTVQLDKMLVVLDALGIGLMVRGPGVSFTAEELAQAAVKRESEDPPHVWEAEFSSGVDRPKRPDASEKPHRGRTPGTVALKYRRQSSVREEGGTLVYETVDTNPVIAKKKEKHVEVCLRQPKRRDRLRRLDASGHQRPRLSSNSARATAAKAQQRKRRAECREASCPSSFPALQMRLRDAGSGIRPAATQRFSSKSGAM